MPNYIGRVIFQHDLTFIIAMSLYLLDSCIVLCEF